MTVVVLDDHPLLGDALAQALTRRGVDSIAFEPMPGEDHVRMILGLSDSIELIISDLMMPAVPDTVALITELSQTCPVVVLSGTDDEDLRGRCLEAGAIASLSKDEPIEVLLSDLVGYVETGRLRPTARIIQLQSYEQSCRARRELLSKFELLTVAEREVLKLLCEGVAAAHIAEQRFVSLPTVRTQIKAILTKLGASSQLEAVAIANRHSFASTSN